MVLTRGDDFPLHQTAEPIAYAGTDRNFYDRYFFNGYAPASGDERMFALTFGVYPQLNIADASFCWLDAGRQVNLHASRWLEMERLNLQVGPIAITVEEPLQRLRLTVTAPDQGMAAELVFAGRAFPIEEPRFTRRIGPRTLLDYVRMTQNGRYTGWVEIDGRRIDLTGFVGTRDRSWGVRPVGARDPQAPAPAVLPQFFWLWSPCIFAEGDFFFHTNDDAEGQAWNRRALWVPLGAERQGEHALPAPVAQLSWRKATRHAERAELRLGADSTIEFRPVAEFFMLGLGYNHPKWGHGSNLGPLAVEREDFVTTALDRSQLQHFHIQALSEVCWKCADGTVRRGRGVLEQLAIGAHAPSGFTDLRGLA
jgi:hypothetical protein